MQMYNMMLFLGEYKLQAELRERRAVEEEHGDVNLLLEPLEAEVAMNDEHGEGALVDPVVYLQTWIPLISEDDKGKWTTVVAVHSTKCMTDCLYFTWWVLPESIQLFYSISTISDCIGKVSKIN